jgi:hypothetical protein
VYCLVGDGQLAAAFMEDVLPAWAVEMRPALIHGEGGRGGRGEGGCHRVSGVFAIEHQHHMLIQ